MVSMICERRLQYLCGLWEEMGVFVICVICEGTLEVSVICERRLGQEWHSKEGAA